jgi:hypothetical protein
MSFVTAPPYVPKHKIRVVTAASLFDGHDAVMHDLYEGPVPRSVGSSPGWFASQTHRMCLLVLRTLLILLPFGALAQVSVTTNMREMSAPELDPQVIRQLRQTTTLFFLRSGEEDMVARVQDRLNSFWTISKIEVHPYSDLKSTVERHVGEPLSYLMLTATAVMRDGTIWDVAPHLDLRMNMVLDAKDGSDAVSVARIALQLTRASGSEAMKLPNYHEELVPFLYTKAEIHNWSLGLVLNYARAINRQLEKGEPIVIHNDIVDAARTAPLRTATLFVRDDAGLKWSRSKNAAEMRDPKEVFAKYPYQYAFIAKEELDRKLWDEKDDFYFLVYYTSGGNISIDVRHSIDGELIYHKSAFRLSPEFDEGDAGDLAKVIKKGGKD